jgi:hypothetical protein
MRNKEEEANNAERHSNNVDQEVSVIVDRNAVVDPWAVASEVSNAVAPSLYLLILLRDASVALLTMLTS